MCGIAGILHYGVDEPVERSLLEALRDAQRHRGPDDDGLWIDERGRVGLAHRRLSIIDLSAGGHQPMASGDGRVHVVYNGEIYNYPALRRELEARGHGSRTASDTEALLHGYREWGLGLLDRLRGMFAFALHDAERQETLLARDPMGIKPLYFADDGRRLAFASEVQPLRRAMPDGGVDPEALVDFLQWGSIAPPRTLYRGIRALPPGSWLRIAAGRVTGPVRYFELESEFGRTERMDEGEAAERSRAALMDSVRHHLLADVPVGAFLSGGVDSSALVGLLTEVHDGPVRTVTLACDVPDLDEGPLARLAAKEYGTDHREIPMRIDEIRERMPDAMRALDQPSIDGINTYFVSEAAVRADLKVAVSGVGGDELFGGYLSFARIPRIRGVHDRVSRLPGAARLLRPGGAVERLARGRRVAKLGRALAWGGDDAGAYFAVRGLFAPHEVRELLDPSLSAAVEACDPRRELEARLRIADLPLEERISALEIRQYLEVQLLRDSDATSMRHSLELRTPLVDRELLRALLRIPAELRRAGPAKRRLREAPRPPVPAALWQRRKQGFTLPFEHWLRSGGLPVRRLEHPWLRRRALERLESDFRSGRVHWSRVWALQMLGPFLE